MYDEISHVVTLRKVLLDVFSYFESIVLEEGQMYNPDLDRNLSELHPANTMSV